MTILPLLVQSHSHRVFEIFGAADSLKDKAIKKTKFDTHTLRFLMIFRSLG